MPIGGGWKIATTRPGIPRCACFGRMSPVTGGRSLSVSWTRCRNGGRARPIRQWLGASVRRLACTRLARLQHHFDALVLFVAEHGVALRRLVQGEAMRDHEAWIDTPLFNELQERPQVTLNVCLAGFDGQC